MCFIYNKSRGKRGAKTNENEGLGGASDEECKIV